MPHGNDAAARAARLPKLTDEQRAAASEKALECRRRRADALARIAAGDLSAASVLESEDPALRRMRIEKLLRALPGIGSAKAAKVMAGIGIPADAKVQSLGPRQRRRLKDYLNSMQLGRGR